MNLPLIVFDWDGTLADSMDLCVAEIRAALEGMGLPVPKEALLRQCNGPGNEETVAMLNIPAARGPEYLERRLRAGLALCPRVNRLFPGIRPMLQRLRGKAEMCIVSNGSQDYLALCLRIFHLEDTFTRVLAFRPGHTKAENLSQLLQERRPARAIMVGDRLGDIQAGKANGLPTLCAAYGYGSPQEWAQADAIAKDVTEISRMLAGWTAGDALP